MWQADLQRVLQVRDLASDYYASDAEGCSFDSRVFYKVAYRVADAKRDAYWDKFRGIHLRSFRVLKTNALIFRDLDSKNKNLPLGLIP